MPPAVVRCQQRRISGRKAFNVWKKKLRQWPFGSIEIRALFQTVTPFSFINLAPFSGPKIPFNCHFRPFGESR